MLVLNEAGLDVVQQVTPADHRASSRRSHARAMRS